MERDPEGRKEAPASVYVATSEGRTKIGIAGEVALRMRQLTNGSGAEVVLVASRPFSTRVSAEAIEAKLHRRFHGGRLHGEWFSTKAEKVVAALESLEDPNLHCDEWAPGMPPEVAQGGSLARWRWKRDQRKLPHPLKADPSDAGRDEPNA